MLSFLSDMSMKLLPCSFTDLSLSSNRGEALTSLFFPIPSGGGGRGKRDSHTTNNTAKIWMSSRKKERKLMVSLSGFGLSKLGPPLPPHMFVRVHTPLQSFLLMLI